MQYTLDPTELKPGKTVVAIAPNATSVSSANPPMRISHTPDRGAGNDTARVHHVCRSGCEVNLLEAI
jgi:hypothetical protein